MQKTKSLFQQLHEANLKITELEKQIDLLTNSSQTVTYKDMNLEQKKNTLLNIIDNGQK